MTKPHIVYGVDKRYLAPLLVSMYSVLRTASRNVKITILTTEPPVALNEPDIRRLGDCFPDAEIYVQYFDSANLREFEETTTTRWPRVSLTPLLLPWLVPGRCVLLDADTLVLRDIVELYDTDMRGMAFGACQSPTTALTVRKHLTFGLNSIIAPARNRRRRRELGEWKDRMGFTFDELRTEYFSSGTLLYDTEAIRRMDPTRDLANVELSRKHWASMPDMDRLNEFFKGRFHHLALKWNVYRDIMPVNRVHASPALWSEIQAATRDPALLHYSAFFRRKPWRRPWYNTRRRYSLYKSACMEMQERTGIEILRMLDQREDDRR